MGLVMGPTGGKPSGPNQGASNIRGSPSDSGAQGFVLPGLGNALASLAQEQHTGRTGRQGSGAMSPAGQLDPTKTKEHHNENLINKYKIQSSAVPGQMRKGAKKL